MPISEQLAATSFAAALCSRFGFRACGVVLVVSRSPLPFLQRIPNFIVNGDADEELRPSGLFEV